MSKKSAESSNDVKALEGMLPPAPPYVFGRPTDYKPEFCQTVIELGRAGKSIAQMASHLDISKQCLNEWRTKHPDFGESMLRAITHAQAKWEKIHEEGAQGTMDVNAPVLNKAMSARFADDYTERNKTELTGKDGQPMEHALILRDLSEDELTARIEAAMKAMGNG